MSYREGLIHTDAVLMSSYWAGWNYNMIVYKIIQGFANKIIFSLKNICCTCFIYFTLIFIA